MIIKKRIFTFIGLSALIVVSFLIIIATNSLILTPEFYKKSGEFLGMPNQGMDVYLNAQKWVFVFEAIYLIFKISIIALILNTALYLSEIPQPYMKVFTVVMFSEFIFMIAAMIKVYWFHNHYPNGTLADWHKIFVFSILSIIGDVPADWYYPLEVLNIFEVSYWFLLAYGLAKITGRPFDYSLGIVIKSYVPALLIWIAGVTFCSLMFFPQQG